MPKTRRIIAVLAATLVVTLCATGLLASPAEASSPGPFRQHTYGNCLDASLARGNLGQPQLWSCNGASNQQFASILFSAGDGTTCCFEFVNQQFGTCLTAYSPSITASDVQLQPCNDDLADGGNPANKWKVWFANNTGNGWYQILQSVSTGDCLDLVSAHGNGAPLTLGTCNQTHTYQFWTIP